METPDAGARSLRQREVFVSIDTCNDLAHPRPYPALDLNGSGSGGLIITGSDVAARPAFCWWPGPFGDDEPRVAARRVTMNHGEVIDSIAFPGDLNDDGLQDMLVGTRQGVIAFCGSTDGPVRCNLFALRPSPCHAPDVERCDVRVGRSVGSLAHADRLVVTEYIRDTRHLRSAPFRITVHPLFPNADASVQAPIVLDPGAGRAFAGYARVMARTGASNEPLRVLAPTCIAGPSGTCAPEGEPRLCGFEVGPNSWRAERCVSMLGWDGRADTFEVVSGQLQRNVTVTVIVRYGVIPQISRAPALWSWSLRWPFSELAPLGTLTDPYPVGPRHPITLADTNGDQLLDLVTSLGPDLVEVLHGLTDIASRGVKPIVPPSVPASTMREYIPLDSPTF